MISSRFLCCLLFLSFLSGCSNSPKPDVVATTGMIADAAQRIAGGKLRIDCLMGPGVDPHKFTPSASDSDKLASAKLVLYNGLHLEGKIVDVLEKPTRGQRTVAVTRTLEPVADLRKADVDGGEHDPHVWFDVRLWMKCVDVIRDELCASFPEHADEFRKNAAEYQAELQKLDAEVREKANSLPPEKRILVTSHDAFGYFGKAYGFEVRGLQGVSTAAGSDTNDVEALSKFIIDKQVKAIFTETSVPTSGLSQVLAAVKYSTQREVRLIAGENALYSDALGEAGSSGGSYLGMVRHNIDVIVNGLK